MGSDVCLETNVLCVHLSTHTHICVVRCRDSSSVNETALLKLSLYVNKYQKRTSSVSMSVCLSVTKFFLMLFNNLQHLPKGPLTGEVTGTYAS